MKKIVSCMVLFSTIFMLFINNFFVSATEEPKKVLSLGDSISAGYGLDSPETECFVYGISGNAVNMAINGNKATDIKEQLFNENHEKHVTSDMIKDAEVITITCGGNDLMAFLYEKTAEEWNKVNPESTIEAKDVLQKISEKHFGILFTAINLLNPDGETYILNSQGFSESIDRYISNLNEIVLYINKTNPEAAVIIATQYNPYVEFKNTSYDVVYRGMEYGVSKLNEAIISNAKEGGYIVSDVKSLFDSCNGEEDLYNADIATMEFDFHPSADGHKILAQSFKNTVSEIKYVNYTITHFYETANGSYESEKKNFKAVTGNLIFAEKCEKQGFEFIETDKNVLRAKAETDKELIIYYNRKTFSITWDNTVEKYKYGDVINAPALKKDGFVFLGWDKEIPSEMPSENLVFKSLWKEEKINPTYYVIVVLLVLAVVVSVVSYINNKKIRKNQENKG